jgi:altronate dehydratase small subunit
VLRAKDNVATALDDLRAGENLELAFDDARWAVTLRADIPFGHKFGLTEIEPNAPVIKYGEVIGLATAAIGPGDYVHVHNIASARARGDLKGERQ